MKQLDEQEKRVLKERCRICQKTCEFTVDNFRFCLSCGHIACRHCVKTCELCHQREICVICSERAQDREGIRIPLHLCEKCVESLVRGKGEDE